MTSHLAFVRVWTVTFVSMALLALVQQVRFAMKLVQILFASHLVEPAHVNNHTFFLRTPAPMESIHLVHQAIFALLHSLGSMVGQMVVQSFIIHPPSTLTPVM
jgi:hypothetical protein